MDGPVHNGPPERLRFGNYNFGNITAAESARIGQLGLKLHF